MSNNRKPRFKTVHKKTINGRLAYRIVENRDTGERLYCPTDYAKTHAIT
jgi:hypothetical protein